jgi:hypothetical protein
MELAGALHMTRRFLLGKAAANPLEAAVFATLNRMSRDILSCTVAAFDAAPPGQRNRLFAPSFLLDPDQPLDKATLSTALAKEIAQRAGVLVFGDPQGPEQDRPGRIRVYKPSNLHRTRPQGDIVVNVNKTIPPLKLPLECHETREYVSSSQDSRYEITYRYNRVS